MAKWLLVGDCHATVDSLEECQKLIDHISKIAKEKEVKVICFLGDQYHNHGIVHLPVQAFWHKAFESLSEGHEVYALVGNHDKALTGNFSENALMLHSKVKVISKPTLIEQVLLVPYVNEVMEFIDVCNTCSWCKLLIAHQSFSGARLDNGYFDPNGINSDLIPQKQIISGHIHTGQEFGKVWYPGSPRWRTLSDVNKDKNIWVVDIEDGEIKSKDAYETKEVCRPIYVFEDTEGSPLNPVELKADCTVDISGTQEYIDSRKGLFESLGYKVRTIPMATKNLKVKESDGIASSLMKFLGSFNAPKGTPNEVLTKIAMERITWLQPK